MSSTESVPLPAAPPVCRDVAFEELVLGERVTFSRQWTDADVATFAQLVGDFNPIHCDEAYARTSLFERRIVHGMLVGSLCSTLVGMHLPGKRCLFLSQSLRFLLPVFIGDTVEVTGTIVSRDERTQVITIAVLMTRDADAVVDGLASVQVF
jgi:3-hydroxybutyryl-CoA dehydratase